MASRDRKDRNGYGRQRVRRSVELLEPRRMLTGAVPVMLDFDGTDDHVDVPAGAASELNLTGGAFTVEARVNPHSWGADSHSVVLDHSTVDKGWTFRVIHDRDVAKKAVLVEINGQGFASNASVLTKGAWQHIAATLDSGTLSFFVDGVKKGEQTGVPTPEAVDSLLRIGARASDRGRPLDGYLDDVGIWDVALTPQQIADRAAGGEVKADDAGLVAFYQMNENGGQTVSDLTGTHGGVRGSDDSNAADDPAWRAKNEAPVARNDAVAVQPGTPTPIHVLLNDFDPDGQLDVTSVSIVIQPKFGTATVGADGVVTYSPNADFTGTDEFTYTVLDSLCLASNEATVSIGDTGNKPPVAVDDYAELRSDTSAELKVLKNDYDLDGRLKKKTLTITQQPQHGTVSINRGVVTYVPETAFAGDDSFKYTINDREGATSNEALVSLLVQADDALIKNINFKFKSLDRRALGSDNWPLTWSDDDHQYTSWGDGSGFGLEDKKDKTDRVPLGYARIEGTADNYEGYNVWGGKDPENPAQFGGKSFGMISINGVLYSFNMVPKSYFKKSELYYSTDKGATWQSAGWRFEDLNSAFSVPTFVNFGKDNQAARDNYVYIYAPGAKDLKDEGKFPGANRFNSADTIELARVHKKEILDRSKYQFFNGFDSNGDPKWTSNIANRDPIFTDPAAVHWSMQVSYIPGIDRFLLFNNRGPGYSEPERCGCIDIYEASEPWGPFTRIERFDDFGGFGYTFSHYVAPKWTSEDGLNFTLVFSGRYKTDSWNAIKGEIELK